ncbi:TauD/TfdA dioxygenase family protein [Streptomyces polyrhachis]|uniref:TauD/TfdA dioxygenase family protein n=1 Tax=Streptomyces polyrhachis TaxID=1282885 RepID=A0ABW2GKJ9_9ACTN
MERPRLTPRRFGAASEDFNHIDVRPYSTVIGAEIGGVDLSTPLEPATLAEIRRAFLDWKVLFFRGQHLTVVQHADLARHWGELYVNPHLPDAGIEQVARIVHDESDPGNENMWHSDATHWDKPPLGSLLRAVKVPEFGGDTLWADLGAAYDGLPQALKERLVGLTAIHTQPAPDALSAALLRRKGTRVRHSVAEHPLVREHPETGRPILFVNPVFTSHVVGLPSQDSSALLDLLFRQVSFPEYQVRFRWEVGSIAFWDNRSTVHYGVNDYFPSCRIMERATILGDRPFPPAAVGS